MLRKGSALPFCLVVILIICCLTITIQKYNDENLDSANRNNNNMKTHIVNDIESTTLSGENKVISLGDYDYNINGKMIPDTVRNTTVSDKIKYTNSQYEFTLADDGSYINLCIIRNNEITIFALDRRTQFVGIPMTEIGLEDADDYYSFNDTKFPQLAHAKKVSANDGTKTNLILKKVGSRYCIKNPNLLNIKQTTTALTFSYPDTFDKLIMFKTTKYNPYHLNLNDNISSFLGSLSNYQHLIIEQTPSGVNITTNYASRNIVYSDKPDLYYKTNTCVSYQQADLNITLLNPTTSTIKYNNINYTYPLNSHYSLAYNNTSDLLTYDPANSYTLNILNNKLDTLLITYDTLIQYEN